MTGELTTSENLPALRLPDAPALLVLAGGSRIEELGEADLPAGIRLRVEGAMHASHEDKPAGMTVESWERAEP